MTTFWFKIMLYVYLLVTFRIGRFKALLAQSALETDYWNSKLFKKHNNAFGMQPSSKRKRFWAYETKDISDNPDSEPANYFAGYTSLWSSIRDRVDLDRFNGIKWKSDEQYVQQVVNAGYCAPAEASVYRKTWMDMLTFKGGKFLRGFTTFVVLFWVLLISVLIITRLLWLRLKLKMPRLRRVNPFAKKRKGVFS